MATYIAPTTTASTSFTLLSEISDDGSAYSYTTPSGLVLTAQYSDRIGEALAAACKISLTALAVGVRPAGSEAPESVGPAQVVDVRLAGMNRLHLLVNEECGDVIHERVAEMVEFDLSKRTFRCVEKVYRRGQTRCDSTLLSEHLSSLGFRRAEEVEAEIAAATPSKSLDGFTTAKELREYLEGWGVRDHAADALVRETAHHRHSYRVGRVEELALKAGRDWFDLMDDTAGEKRGQYGQVAYYAAAALLVTLDLAGIGGRDACDGAGTDRMGWAQKLGSGRKQAGDGAAWTAAEKYALGRLVQTHGHALVIAPMPEMVPGDPHGGLDLWMVDGAGDVVPTSTCGVLVKDLSSGMLAWFRTLAREGLRLSMGQSAWLPELPAEIRFTGPAGDWARVVNEIQQCIFAPPFAPETAKNYHLTWTESGLTSDGWTTQEPGEYEPSEESGRTARCIVAPGSYVQEYLRQADPAGRYANSPAQAVRAYARDKGWYCA